MAGEPLVELADQAFGLAEAARLVEVRRAAQEDLVEARLSLGEHAGLVGELEAAVAAEPLRERRWAQLMLALYRGGRQADALRAYQRLRTVLADELGIEPSTELRALEDATLLQKPELDLTSDGGPGRRGVDKLILARDSSTGRAVSSSVARTATPLPSGVVTFLLTDIEGSSRLWESNPVDMAQVLERHDELIAETVSLAGGVLIKSKSEGDSTLSVFQRASAAAAAAMELQRRLAEEPWPAGMAVALRMALHTGEAHERDGDYFGPAVNRAARLRSLSAGGRVLLSSATTELLRDRQPDQTVLADIGRHELRGLSRYEHVFELVPTVVPTMAGEAHEAPARLLHEIRRPPFPAALAPGQRSFVGREPERAQLDAAIASRNDGRRLVFVAGEAGIGKSRLAAEAARSAYDVGATVLYGRCDEGLGSAYQPWMEALHHYVSSVPLSVFARQMGPAFAELTWLLPELGETPQGEPDRWRLFQAVDDVLARASAESPLVVVLDDLHWADASSVLLLRHLARSTRPGQLLIVGIYREPDLNRKHPLADVLADLRRDRRAERISLRGLDEADVGELIRSHDMDAALTTAVYAETEGNPFFVIEILHHLAESDQQIEHLGIPAGIQEVIDRRLARLSTEANEALAVAAVIGAEFDAALVEAAGGPGAETFEEPLRARLIQEVADRFGRYTFSHALVRQTLYAELSTNRRTRLHWRIGELLGERSTPEPDATARHLAAGVLAGDPARAVEACLAAGQASLDRAGWEEAAAHAAQAQKILADAAENEPDLRFRTLRMAEVASRCCGRYELARTAALDAARLAEEQGWVERFVEALDDVEQRAVEADDEHEALIERALASVGPKDGPLRCRLLARRARNLWTSGEPVDQGPLADEVMSMAERLGDRDALGVALRGRCMALHGTAQVAELLDAARSLWELTDTADPRRFGQLSDLESGFRLAFLPAALLQSGDRDGAERGVAKIAERAAATRLRGVAYMAKISGAVLACLDGRFDEAKGLAVAARPFVGDMAIGQRNLSAIIAFARLEQGRHAQVGPELRQLLVELPKLWGWHARSALVECDLGNLDVARVEIEALAMDDFRAVRYDLLRPMTWRCLAEVCANLGDTDHARQLLRFVEPYAGQLLVISMQGCVEGAADRSVAQLLATLGRRDEAVIRYQAALRLEEHVGAAPLAGRTRYWYARLLHERRRPGDCHQASELLNACLATTRELGMAMLEQQAGVLLTRCQ